MAGAEAVAEDSVEASAIGDGSPLSEAIIAALRTVYDPEISVNLYDLGLIYRLDIEPAGRVAIQMTLTAPACPVAGILPGQVEAAVRTVAGVSEVTVELVWEPPWDQERMSDEARLSLGLF
jgi:FeS assembly SUF system protein